MLDIGWSEILVIAVVLIVVVGPKDLPPMLRAFGRMSRRFTAMAADFRKQFDDALNENDMGDLRKTISDVQRMHPGNAIREAISPLRQAADDLKADIRKTVEAPSAVVPPPADDAPVSPATAAAPAAATPAPAAVPAMSTAEVAAALPSAEKPKRKPKAKSEPEPVMAAAVDQPARKAASRKKTEAAAAATPAPEAKPRKKTAPKKDKA